MMPDRDLIIMTCISVAIFLFVVIGLPIMMS